MANNLCDCGQFILPQNKRIKTSDEHMKMKCQNKRMAKTFEKRALSV